MSLIPRWLVGALLLIAAAPALATWRVAETAHFRVYDRQSEKRLRERATLLEDYVALLKLLTNRRDLPEGAPRLDVFLIDDVADAMPFERPDQNIAGFYVATPGRIAAFAETGATGQVILLHEYTHHFMLGSNTAAYPKWYVEGFAEYFATAKFNADTIEFGGVPPGRGSQLVRGDWLPLTRLLARDPALRGPAETAAFYAESWLLAHYLQRVPGQSARLRAYLAAVAGGADSLSAFREHVDPDIEAFERRLRRYMTSRDMTLSRFPRPSVAAADVRVTALPPSADALLLRLTALELTRPRDNRRALAEITKATARYPGDAFARRVLAFATLRLGDRGAAAPLIDALLAEAPDDAKLLRWRALASDGADRAAMRRLLVRSYRADPSDWRTMLAYVRLADPRIGRLDDNDLAVALRAHELAPQVGEVVLVTATALAQADRLAEASRILAPLAYSSHNVAMTAIAGALLQRAQAGDKAGFLALVQRPSRGAPPPAE
ncbi:hypothetical protein [Sandarakinorhabdus sp. DWP1-3-1]|uniref:hypothetical protein n=1 Tax=Sandarakinorhabdus sp. DWP1-3-1 TaxID=2804627 RepID=UPI003CF89002